MIDPLASSGRHILVVALEAVFHVIIALINSCANIMPTDSNSLLIFYKE